VALHGSRNIAIPFLNPDFVKRVIYKLRITTHNVVIGPAPEYRSDMVTPVFTLGGHAYLRLAALGLHDVLSTKTHMGAETSVASLKAWNSLPQSVHALRSTATSNVILKTYLF
jgi:hypothetical protein